MLTRVETAAATRRSLVESAGALLSGGGAAAVTLRDVGTRAGVSRSALYRHFADKETLLMALAAQGWNAVSDALEPLVDDAAVCPRASLHQALMTLVTVGRSQPHLYRLMFATPIADPTAAVRAAGRAQDLFLQIVTKVVAADQAQRCAGLLLATAHGITALELSGHLTAEKWDATAEELVELRIHLLPNAS